MNKYLFYILFPLNLLSLVAYGQHQTAARIEIDMKRKELNEKYSSPEAILRSREFIRLDSTYYVGYMCEAFFRFDRAADQRGYQEAIPNLKKALELYEKDFQYVLENTYKSKETYLQYNDRMMDYVYLTDKLMDCYSNLEKPDSVIYLLNHYKSWDFQYDYLGADNYIAWTYHRNRFYTSSRYSFLSDSVMGNEEIALRYLKNSEMFVDKNAAANEDIMPYYRVLGSKMSVYHYMSIVYSYMRQPDSARYYYNLMSPYNIFPYNNYAIFCYVNGMFGESEFYFQRAMYRERDDYRLQEPYYYLSIINTMKGRPESSTQMLKEFIEKQGVRPGWGWYNIALGRAYLYNGEIEKSKEVLDKALRFKEIHIGTTLGESHYNFSRDILLLMNLENRVKEIKFKNKRYWLSFTAIKDITRLNLEIFNKRISLFRHLSNNPEREELYYRLFASEGTTSFDETYSLIKDYGRSFFIKSFEKQYETDERDNIKKYFLLLKGKLLCEKGNTKEAIQIFEKLLNEDSEEEFEVLYLARLYEGLAFAYEDQNKEDLHRIYVNKMYSIFSQLMPFSDVKMSFNIVLDNASPELVKIIEEMKTYNINFSTNSKKSGLYSVYLSDYDDSFICNIEDDNGREFSQFMEKKGEPKDVAQKIINSLFKIGMELEEDYDY